PPPERTSRTNGGRMEGISLTETILAAQARPRILSAPSAKLMKEYIASQCLILAAARSAGTPPSESPSLISTKISLPTSNWMKPLVPQPPIPLQQACLDLSLAPQ